MTTFAVAAGGTLFLMRAGASWSVEPTLEGKDPEAVAVDPGDPRQVYVGTRAHGLWRSRDGGSSWEPAQAGIPHRAVTAVAVAPGVGSQGGVVYVGTEPSRVARSDDGGNTWVVLEGLNELASADEWSFPPRPETHHVRWIEIDPRHPARLYVAIEAGALVRSADRGDHWTDRVRGGPIDTHTAATHPDAPGRLVCAAGDGYFESDDGGDTWHRPMRGLRHGYLVGVALDRGDPEVVLVSASKGPYLAYWPPEAQGYVYRKRGDRPFEPAMDGLPPPDGTVASRIVAHPERAGAFYIANNHGLFRSDDSGRTWQELAVDWPQGALARGVGALAVIEP